MQIRSSKTTITAIVLVLTVSLGILLIFSGSYSRTKTLPRVLKN